MPADYQDLIRRARWNAAYDSAMAQAREDSGNIHARYSAVLCLARAGSLEQAQTLFKSFELEQQSADEDIAALAARISKGLMVEARGERQFMLARKAKSQYASAYAINDGSYPGINTATLAYLLGDIGHARQLAQRITDDLEACGTHALSPQAHYYHLATLAEAALIMGKPEIAFKMLAQAIEKAPENYAARATTLRQFEMLSTQITPDISAMINAARPPAVIHYTGHIYSHHDSPHRSFAFGNERALARQIDETFERHTIGEGFGALAAGSDIMIAERLLERGGILNVILPTGIEAFQNISVSPFGKDWNLRFQACLNRAHSVRIIDPDLENFDAYSFANCSHIAMGLSTLRAKARAAMVYQLAVWDKEHSSNTAYDRHVWISAGRQTIDINWPGSLAELSNKEISTTPDALQRKTKAMLFADIAGFGNVTDKQVPDFVKQVFTPLAAICADLPNPAQTLDTWGDGIFLTFDTVSAAADAALALQSGFRDIIATLTPEFQTLALRIGGHCGPVYIGQDPFHDRLNTYGRNVVIASRIEPLVLPGAIYVSTPFACMLDVSHPEQYQCGYVGKLRHSKESQPLELYSLRKGLKGSNPFTKTATITSKSK